MLRFTTSAPGFMCDTSDRNEEVISKLEGERKFIGFKQGETPIYHLYIDGSLEDWIGFDLPIWLSGEILKLRKQPCIVHSVDGTEKREATLSLFQEGEERCGSEPVWKLRGFITDPDELVDWSKWIDPERYREIPEEELCLR